METRESRIRKSRIAMEETLADILRRNMVTENAEPFREGERKEIIESLQQLGNEIHATVNRLTIDASKTDGRRGYLSDRDYDNIRMMILHAGMYEDLSYWNSAINLRIIVECLSLFSTKYCDADGVIYDEYLLCNMDYEQRMEIANEIGGALLLGDVDDLCENDKYAEELKSFAEGNMEISEVFEGIIEKLNQEWTLNHDKITYISETPERKSIRKLDSLIRKLSEKDDLNDKKIESLVLGLKDYITENKEDTFLERNLKFWANEALSAVEKDEDINKVYDVWVLIRGKLEMMIEINEDELLGKTNKRIANRMS